jgi:hypothetical protein
MCEPPVESEVSSSEEDDDGTRFKPLAQHNSENALAFHLKFTVRQLSDLLKIVNLGTIPVPRHLYASLLRHRHLDAKWSRADGYLRSKSLKWFVQACLDDGNYSTSQREELWLKVLADEAILRHLHQLPSQKMSEIDVRGWWFGLMLLIRIRLGEGRLRESTVKRFGIGGALAYTDPASGANVPEAAYLSRLDHCYIRAKEKTPFVGVEFKHVSFYNNCIWHNINSALPQTLCALSGNENCLAGLFLCNLGFVVIWRKQIGHNGRIPIYDYFMFPKRTAVPDNPYHPRRPLMRDCFSEEHGEEGRLDLLRVMFEIALASFVADKDKSESPKRKSSVRLVDDDSYRDEDDNNEFSDSDDGPVEDENADKPRYFGVSSKSHGVGYFTCFDAPDDIPGNDFDDPYSIRE